MTAPRPEDRPPRWSWKVLLPWSRERTEWTLYIAGKTLKETVGLDIIPQTRKEDMPTLDEVPIGRLRLAVAFLPAAAAACLALGLGLSPRSCLMLAAVGLMWFPFRPVRVLAVLAMIPAWVALVWLGLLILAGGPDSRGGPGSAVVIPLVLAAAAELAGLVWLCARELRARP